MAKKTWSELTTGQKTRAVVGTVIQLALAGIAWADLAKRPAEDVNGPKPVWAFVTSLNFIGPLAYFLFGPRLR